MEFVSGSIRWRKIAAGEWHRHFVAISCSQFRRLLHNWTSDTSRMP